MQANEIIRALREDNDLTQTTLGERIDISQRRLSHIEIGRTEPNLDDIRKICKYFNVSADYILRLPRNLPYPER